MFNWIRNTYSPIGLDIGSTALRGVQLLRRGPSLSVHAALEVPILRLDACRSSLSTSDAEESLEPSSDSDQEVLSSQLRRLIERGGFVGREVVLHCAADKLDMRPIDLPAGPEGLPRPAILGALRLQMAGHLSLPVDQAVFDYYPVAYDNDRRLLTVMAITADGNWIRQRIKLLHSGALRCVGVDALPCTLARLVACPAAEPDSLPEDDSHHSNETTTDSPALTDSLVAILDIGFSGSTLIVRNRHCPLFCRRFALGGKELTNVLTQRLLVDFEHAEKLKLTHGFDSEVRRLQRQPAATASPAGAHLLQSVVESAPATSVAPTSQDAEVAKAIYAALQSELADYVQSLTRALNYIIAQHNGVPLEKIFLCGSAAHMKHFDRFLAEQFEVPVELLPHPLLDEITKFLPTSRAQTGAWTTAVGLALAKESM